MKKSSIITSLILAMILVLSSTIHGQSGDYRTAIGVRGGWAPGLTVKHFVSDRTAIEGMISGWPYGTVITAVGEIHVPLGPAGLKFYYGGGGHVRFYRYYYTSYVYAPWPYRYVDRVYVYEPGVGIGIDGIIGLEYKIPPIPLAISLDFKPFLEVGSTGYYFAAPEFGLGLKVAF